MSSEVSCEEPPVPTNHAKTSLLLQATGQFILARVVFQPISQNQKGKNILIK